MMNSMINHIGWIRSVFNWGRRTQQIFGDRRNNGGGLMFSILGIGIGAAAYSLLTNRENGIQPLKQPISNFMKYNQFHMIRGSDQTAMAEFSEELTAETQKKADDIDYDELF
ncbi:hypothetical protein [Halalkalibacter alkaliphilus]|uniref:Uncharacterized protein n=1 Tax=Halalkalibacter alkaliphilus TaxID=2917993 RepID=A0A9X2CWA1_9BACI|nr:hypothetical protein [Halalkalibacter alkaliphilus]MCL7749490.1 hypothetical protein [Halalkalibacter alkaliphilus]